MNLIVFLISAILGIANSLKVSTTGYNIIHQSPNRRSFAHSSAASRYQFNPNSFSYSAAAAQGFNHYSNIAPNPYASPSQARPYTVPPSGGVSCAAAPAVCPKTPFRSFDGSCNNLQNPGLGQANNRYGRLLSAKYGDGVQSPTTALNGEELPNARLVSLIVFGEEDVPDPEFTLVNMQFGQIITHDMSMQAGGTQSKRHATQCCTPEGKLISKGSAHKTCYPIVIPQHDPAHSQTGTQCMEFVRTLTDKDVSCPDGSGYQAEQLTMVTSFMDLSLVYGNSVQQNAGIRAFQGGLMIVDERNGEDWLPQSTNATADCDAQIQNEICYQAGDVRVNQNPGLTILQTILLREHNRIARGLSKINPHYDDEKLFQEARKINIGQYQHISYYEWLPIFLGTDNMLKNRLIYKVGPDGTHINDYDPSIDPSVLNSHSTGAFRYFHSQIEGRLDLISEMRSITGALRLSDWFNRPGIIELGDNFDSLTRGHATQPEELTDINFDREIKHFLFRRMMPFGGDLRAIDIQRNRDHGLASYNDYREFCGLSRAYSWEGFLDLISPKSLDNLKRLYANPDDVDFTVGGSLETHVAGALAGPTFLCVLTEQFYRTRVGDRFFFENGDKKTGFTRGQLAEIRKASMSRLLCDNGNHISSMQPSAFLTISKSNPVVSCSDLPVVDLSKWRDASVSYDKEYTSELFFGHY